MTPAESAHFDELLDKIDRAVGGPVMSDLTNAVTRSDRPPAAGTSLARGLALSPFRRS